MTQNKKFKRRVRARMALTGEKYTEAKAALERAIKAEMVTVCSECLRAVCWHGYEMCEGARWASTVEKTRAELEKLGLETSEWWVIKS